MHEQEKYKEHIKSRIRMIKIERVGAAVRTFTLLLLCFTTLFLLQAAAAPEKPVRIVLKARDVSILQGEEMPVFTAVSLIAEEDGQHILDAESGYTAKDLADDLGKQSSYTARCEADVNVEGDYPIVVALTEDMQKTVREKWGDQVALEFGQGRLQVKNPVGEWEGEKFRRYDGSYVVSDFVVSKNDTYYFDGEGKMMTGKMILGLIEYQFAKDGKLVSEKAADIDPERPMVALTFDDGPAQRTGELLAQLEKYHAHATFFMLGSRVPLYPEEVKKMKEIGCEFGNHSYSHADLGKADVNVIRSEVDSTDNNIRAIAGQGAALLRPPYGEISDVLRQQAGQPLILWNIDTRDWQTRDAKATIHCVMSQVKDGDIILMHDIHTETIDAALELIPRLHKAGYQLVTVSELAAARGAQMQPGQSYRNF